MQSDWLSKKDIGNARGIIADGSDWVSYLEGDLQRGMVLPAIGAAVLTLPMLLPEESGPEAQNEI